MLVGIKKTSKGKEMWSDGNVNKGNISIPLDPAEALLLFNTLHENEPRYAYAYDDYAWRLQVATLTFKKMVLLVCSELPFHL